MPKLTGTIVLLGIVLMGFHTPASANPVPDNLVLVHVQQHSGLLCEALPITTCEEVVQTTSLIGTLDFDLILHCLPGMPCECAEIECHVRWPGEWTFVAGEACGGMGAHVSATGNEAEIFIPGLDGLPTGSGLLGLARISLEVTGPGEFEIVSASGCPYAEWTGARAGIECGDCYERSCDHGYPAMPGFTPPNLAIDVEEGQEAVDSLRVRSVGLDPSSAFEITSTAEWIALDVEVIEPGGWPEYAVRVTVDAATLVAGSYAGWVVAESDRCRECAWVDVTVTDGTQPSDGAGSWGTLKGLFRDARP